MSLPFSDMEITTLRTLWGEGHSTNEIGRRMHRSKNSVVGKAHRLDLPERPSPIKRDGIVRHPAPPRVLKSGTLPPLPTLVPLLRITLPPQQRLALTRNPPQPAQNVVQLRLPIARARACQYPLWGALHADDRPVFARMCDDPRPGLSPRFCGAPAVVGCSYCSRHDAIAHRKVAEVAA